MAKAGVDCCFFPVYEVEQGVTMINYDPEERGKRVPAAQWPGLMVKTRHLTKPGHAATLESFEGEIERRWQRLKARHEHPLLYTKGESMSAGVSNLALIFSAQFTTLS
ncbi:MAG: hypothetical protein Q7O66_19730 [Dehalococcoidia bacterium]|nr:hypothetical protein [Dehalococcoidia bacterium]